MPPRHLEFVVARAIYAGLRRRNTDSYVSCVYGEPTPNEKTTIDEKFFLMAVARQVLAELKPYLVQGAIEK